jgi:hypothetical protein
MSQLITRGKPGLRRNPGKASESTLHFSLPELIGADHLLAVNLALRTVILFDRHPHVLAEVQCSVGEMSILLPLLQVYPGYCPYEVLLTSFLSDGQVTEEGVRRTRERLLEAKAEGYWDQELRPLRSVISRCRLQTHELGIEIATVLQQSANTLVVYSRKFYESGEKEG